MTAHTHTCKFERTSDKEHISRVMFISIQVLFVLKDPFKITLKSISIIQKISWDWIFVQNSANTTDKKNTILAVEEITQEILM